MLSQQSKSANFGSLLKTFRLRSAINTLSELGDILAECGQVYETSLLTRWQNNSRVPKNRKLVFMLIKIFADKGGIRSIEEANRFMESTGLGHLTTEESSQLPSIRQHPIPFQAPFATIGELIKMYRIRKGLSLHECALSSGFANIQSIEDIESGQVEKPDRLILEKIFKVLELNENQANTILLIGNYTPTDEDVEKIRLSTSSIIDSWPYSIVLYDFCWRIISVNSKHMSMLRLDKDARIQLHKMTPAAIEIVFDSEFMPNKYLKGEDLKVWHKNLLRFIVHFRTLHKSITDEKWYKELIEKMMKNELFHSVWLKALDERVDMAMTRYGRKIFFEPKEKVRLTFNIFVVPLTQDPRFELEFYTPADHQTISYYEKLRN